MAIALQSLAWKRSFPERRAGNAKTEWNRVGLIEYVREDCSAVIITKLLHFIIFSPFLKQGGSHTHTPCTIVCLCVLPQWFLNPFGCLCWFQKGTAVLEGTELLGLSQSRLPSLRVGCIWTSPPISYGKIHMGRGVTSTPAPGPCPLGSAPSWLPRNQDAEYRTVRNQLLFVIDLKAIVLICYAAHHWKPHLQRTWLGRQQWGNLCFNSWGMGGVLPVGLTGQLQTQLYH